MSELCVIKCKFWVQKDKKQHFTYILGVLGGSLVIISSKLRSTSVCCKGEFASCNSAYVDVSLLGEANIELPGGITVDYVGNIGDNANAYEYRGTNSDVVLTQNPSNGGLHGHAMADGRSFTLEYCGASGHVWKEIDVNSLGENEGVDFLEEEESTLKNRPIHPVLLDASFQDTTTKVTYSVKFYYTPEFAAATGLPDLF